MCCNVLCTYALGWLLPRPGCSGKMQHESRAYVRGRYYSTVCMQERSEAGASSWGDEYVCRRQQAESGDSQHLTCLECQRKGRSSDKAVCLVCQTRELGKLEGAGRVRRKRWRRLRRQGAFVTLGSGPPCATVNRRHSQGSQGGQAAFAPTTRLRIHCRQERGRPT